ncbi:fumarylacetoacetate hydrolase family protein [Mycolicibacterium sphagni]|nr:fumarylacetoacetate hydrolase family protein [Mycolicibacterium sphagni]
MVDLDQSTMQPIAGGIEDWGQAAAGGRVDFTATAAPVPIAEVRILAPVTASSTIAGIGMNYWSHLAKLGHTEPPASPVGFIKPRSAIIGHDAEIAYPAITDQLDFEVELVAVLARSSDAADPNPSEALLGYTVGNDVSARDAAAPMVGLDLFTMKALTATSPVGPWITTRDEFGRSRQIDIEIALRVNGEERQRDRTANMIWNIDECLRYVTDRMALDAGDLVFTGTTDGVGLEDGRFLGAGDVVEAEIEGIGVLRNRVAVQSAPRVSGSRDHVSGNDQRRM